MYSCPIVYTLYVVSLEGGYKEKYNIPDNILTWGYSKAKCDKAAASDTFERSL